MKRSHALVLATTLALTLAAGLGQAAISRHTGSPATGTVARGKIGAALPSTGAAARIRALGLDDEDGMPRTGAAGRIKALGLDD